MWFDNTPVPKDHLTHYYGNVIRTLFLVSAFMLLIAFLRDSEFFPLYLFIGVIVVLFLVIAAGLTSPRTKATILIDTILSATLSVFFEYSALLEYARYQDLFSEAFILRQAIAILFFVALYYCVKTLRWMS